MTCVSVNIDSCCQSGLAPMTHSCKVICAFRGESAALSLTCELTWTGLGHLWRRSQTWEGGARVKPTPQKTGLL